MSNSHSHSQDNSNSFITDRSSSSSSFDSTNSFYSTSTIYSNNDQNSLYSSAIADDTVFNKNYQRQVREMVDSFLNEISRDDNFQPLLDLPTVKIETAIDPATPFCFRTNAVFSGYSASSAFALFAAVSQRAKWDAMCHSIHVLKTIDPLTFIYHLKLKATWPTTPRDSLMVAAFRKLSDGRYISVAWSIEDDSLCPDDPSNSYIRMHTRISANLFTPITSNSFKLTQLIDADPKGSIPSFVIKKVSAKSFPATIESIKQAIVNDQKNENFYNEIIESLKSSDIDARSADSDTVDHSDMSTSSRQLNEIQSRLVRIENHLQSINSHTNTDFNCRFTQYAPLVISSVSLLLLLNLNLRKK